MQRVHAREHAPQLGRRHEAGAVEVPRAEAERGALVAAALAQHRQRRRQLVEGQAAGAVDVERRKEAERRRRVDRRSERGLRDAREGAGVDGVVPLRGAQPPQRRLQRRDRAGVEVGGALRVEQRAPHLPPLAVLRERRALLAAHQPHRRRVGHRLRRRAADEAARRARRVQRREHLGAVLRREHRALRLDHDPQRQLERRERPRRQLVDRLERLREPVVERRARPKVGLLAERLLEEREPPRRREQPERDVEPLEGARQLRHRLLEQPREQRLLLEQALQPRREDVWQQRVHDVREPQEGALLVRVARRLRLRRGRQQRRAGDQVHALAVAECGLVHHEREQRRTQRDATADGRCRVKLAERARHVLVNLHDCLGRCFHLATRPQLAIGAAGQCVRSTAAEAARLDPALVA